jgi:hypothetical protein
LALDSPERAEDPRSSHRAIHIAGFELGHEIVEDERAARLAAAFGVVAGGFADKLAVLLAEGSPPETSGEQV